jgi:flagellar basal body-associated protein FliL
MASKTKKIGLIALILVLAAGAAGYFLWNKPHKDVSSAKGLQVNAAELYQAFITDSAAANDKYIDKVLEVSGVIKSTSANQQQQIIVALQTNNSDAAVNCTLEQKDAVIKAGAQIKLKGICTGLGEGDADLGIPGDLYLIRCYIAE